LLKLALPYKKQLEDMYMEVAFKDKYKYLESSRFIDYGFDLEDSSWSQLDFVSVDKHNNIIGFLSAKLNRNNDSVSNLNVVNFHEINITFSKDFRQFLDDLFFKFNFRKINFGVVVGNPAEKMYDKYVQKYNGRVVGVKKDDVILYDNKYYDFKLYEIHRKNIKTECGCYEKDMEAYVGDFRGMGSI
jgi:hypothetical protein